MASAVLRLPALEARIGLRKTAIYARLDPENPQFDPNFPQPIKLGSRAIGFLDEEVQRWIDSRDRARRETI